RRRGAVRGGDSGAGRGTRGRGHQRRPRGRAGEPAMSVTALRGADRVGVIGSAAVHVVLLLALVMVARRVEDPPPLVYAVDLVAAPAPGPAPRRAAEAALPT